MSLFRHKIETFLCGFLKNINTLNEEITSLQSQSQGIQIVTKNCQSISNRLGPILDELTVPDSVMRIIINLPVTESEFKNQLEMLDRKMQFITNFDEEKPKACQEVIENLEIVIKHV
ncbi:uncharacterized protein LOC118761231 [Octopus sinensis]|uniref:Vacuolar protein sorting-associated protein 52 homolog n=1 Tax=Octopus sinensis TaxID=2607531 RepID=A0A7E6EIT9_9MOLL|nr:uncharacterized protein LOC118761231 [Octopus sinensis]